MDGIRIGDVLNNERITGNAIVRLVQGTGTRDVPATGTNSLTLSPYQKNVIVDKPETSGTMTIKLPNAAESKGCMFTVSVSSTAGDGAVNVSDGGDAVVATSVKSIPAGQTVGFFSRGDRWVQFAPALEQFPVQVALVQTTDVPDTGTNTIQLTSTQRNIIVDKPKTSGTFTVKLPPVAECAGKIVVVETAGTSGSGTINIADAGDASTALAVTSQAAGTVGAWFSTGVRWTAAL